MIDIKLFQLEPIDHNGWRCNDGNTITRIPALLPQTTDVVLFETEAAVVLDQLISYMFQIGEFNRGFTLANLFKYSSTNLRAVYTALKIFMV